MSETTGKVLYNLDQGLTDIQKSRARTNIGAAAASDLTTLQTLFTATYGSGTATYNVSGDTLICELNACKVYCSINNTNYCSLKVTVNDGTITADKSTIKSINGNYDGYRIYNAPWNTSSSTLYTSSIPYNINNYGTVEIDILTSDTRLIHLTVWYRADTDNSRYEFHAVEEIRE